MTLLHVERLGGLAGFGGSRAHIRSRGEVDTGALNHEARRTVELLFQNGSRPPAVPDGFRYRITRSSKDGDESIEVPESAVPEAIASCVRDELL